MSRMGQDLIEALREVSAHAEGKTGLRTTQLNVAPVQDAYSVDEIKRVRKNLGMTQGTFAAVIGVSKKTVESWEAGRYSPDGAARRLISVLQKDPEFPEKYNIASRV